MIGLLGLVVGCSSAKNGGGSGPCVDRRGTYVVTWHERSGNCGPIPEQVDVVDQNTATGPVPGCVNSAPPPANADNCTVNLDVTCPVQDKGTVTDRGEVNWSHDGSMGAGIIQVIVNDLVGAIVCSETYDVTYVRR